MFYIISSRIPLISHDNTSRKYFKLFVMGSAFYIMLHYYLNKELRNGFLEKIRKFIYQVMAVDFIIASILLKYLKVSNPEDELDENDDKNTNTDTNKPNSTVNQNRLNAELEEQRRLFLEQHQQRMLEQKLLEQQKQKLLEQQKELNDSLQKSSKSDKKKSDKKKSAESEKSESDKSKSDKSAESEKSKSDKSDKSDKSAESEKSNKSNKSDKSEKKKKPEHKHKKREDNATDTEIPIYEN